MQTFDTENAIKAHFSIKNEIGIGSSSYVSVIKHNALVRRDEDDLVSVQIGSLINGNYFEIDTELAEQADAIHDKLVRFHEGGDHDGLLTLDLLIIEGEGYRLYGEPSDEAEDAEPFEINASTVAEIINAIPDF